MGISGTLVDFFLKRLVFRLPLLYPLPQFLQFFPRAHYQPFDGNRGLKPIPVLNLPAYLSVQLFHTPQITRFRPPLNGYNTVVKQMK